MAKRQKSLAEITAEAEGDREQLRRYCQNCTDNQLQNVLEKEQARYRAISSPYSIVAATAKVFADEAKAELRHRGLS